MILYSDRLINPDVIGLLSCFLFLLLQIGKVPLRRFLQPQFVLGPVIGSRSDATSIKAVKARPSWPAPKP